jgi:FkbM family methyltransferase
VSRAFKYWCIEIALGSQDYPAAGGPCGLGAREADEVIHVANASVSSSLLPSNAYAHERFGHAELVTREETIRIRRLDQALLEAVPDIRHRRMLLKIDTQGYDLEVFAGAAGVIDLVSILQSEVSCRRIYEGMPHWTNVISTYEQVGFGVSAFFPVTRDGDQVVEFDCLMTQRSTREKSCDPSAKPSFPG